MKSAPFRFTRWASRAPLALACALAAGCLDEDTDEECEPMPFFCDRSRPTEADLTILVGGGGALQEIQVYSGLAVETGTLVWSGTSARTLRLPLGDYSAKATYLSGGKTRIAVDGDNLDYSSDEYCEGTCYDEVDGTVDLRWED
jgi:hypothetical protein